MNKWDGTQLALLEDPNECDSEDPIKRPLSQ